MSKQITELFFFFLKSGREEEQEILGNDNEMRS